MRFFEEAKTRLRAGGALIASLPVLAVLALALAAGPLPVFGQVQPVDDVYVSCGGGGTVPKGSTQTFTCTISNDTGYDISWSVSSSGSVSASKVSLSSPVNGVRTGTV